MLLVVALRFVKLCDPMWILFVHTIFLEKQVKKR
jgi:hypothetical protein